MNPAGRPVVGDLFDTFDMDQLPNAVNMPTYERLCTFLRDDLDRADLVPHPISVREVVEAIEMYKATNTLCWLVAQETSGESGAAYDGLGDFGSTQRIFAHCAKAVFAKVDTAVSAIKKTAPSIMATALSAPKAPVANDPEHGDSGDLDQWLTLHDLHYLRGPLQTLGVFVLQDLPFGIAEGEITVESLVDAGAKSRLQAGRLLRRAAEYLKSEA